MLTKEKIEELASRPGVRRIAVENFLMTVDANEIIEHALGNLQMDARLYKWNAATISAINTGIRLHFQR